MTVVNVTDAVLKGDVTGPTFTGSVDGAKFTGSVTYTDTGTEPPPTTSTEGQITGFNAANGSSFSVGGQQVHVQNGNKSWSIKKSDDYTLRFEVHSGDRWSSSGGYSDPTTAERSEVQHSRNFPLGAKIIIEYGLTIEPGSVNTAQWILFGQLHQLKADGSPPFSVNMYGDKLGIIVRGPDNRENRIWTDNQNIVRGRKYALKVEMVFNSNSTTGTCKVWRDGTQIVNHNGAFGSGASGETYYWKEGIYRNEANETIAASFSNLSVKTG